MVPGEERLQRSQPGLERDDRKLLALSLNLNKLEVIKRNTLLLRWTRRYFVPFNLLSRFEFRVSVVYGNVSVITV